MKGLEPGGSLRDTPTRDADRRGMSSPLQPQLLRGGGSPHPPQGLPREPLTPQSPPCECARSPRAVGLILRLLSPRGKAPI